MASLRMIENQKAADRAGLKYVTDGVSGITRRRAGSGWAFYKPDGTRITDSAQRKRIKSLAIPPAWADVWICPDPRGHIQATGRDARGRKQYRYHPRYREARDKSKFRHLLEMSEVLPGIRERVERDLSAPEMSLHQILATVVRLLDKTLIRIGNDEYMKAYQSYGLTTLRREHVQVEGSTLRFSFRGKSGVQQALSITDRRIARIVQRCQDLPGQELFRYFDGSTLRGTVTSDDVNDYLKKISGRNITAKNFRTWGGTILAGMELSAIGPAENQRAARRNINLTIDKVARRLGNTRAVCRKYYVHPALLQAYLQGLTPPPPAGANTRNNRRNRSGASLRRDEVAILQFLQKLE